MAGAAAGAITGDYTVHLMGPPSSGGIAIGQMLAKTGALQPGAHGL